MSVLAGTAVMKKRDTNKLNKFETIYEELGEEQIPNWGKLSS